MTRFCPPVLTIRECQLRIASKYTWPQTQHGGRPEKPKASAPNGWPDLETLVRQHALRRTYLSGSNDEGHVRCASAKRRPAQAMSRMQPSRRISCSGADPLQIHRSHCTSTAKGSGNASRHGRGTAAPMRYPVTRRVMSESTCALRPTNFKLWMTPEAELVFARERS